MFFNSSTIVRGGTVEWYVRLSGMLGCIRFPRGHMTDKPYSGWHSHVGYFTVELECYGY